MNAKMNPTDAWKRLLTPERLLPELLSVSLMNLYFELLKDSVIDQVRSYFSHGFKDGKSVPSPRYRSEVLLKNKHTLMASLLWLKEADAIDESDIEAVEQFRCHRNDVIHELPERLGSASTTVEQQIVAAGLDVMEKVDKWFIREVEIPCNPEVDAEKVDLEKMMSGRMILLQIINHVLSGNRDYIAGVESALETVDHK